jgi:PKD repeat protein
MRLRRRASRTVSMIVAGVVMTTFAAGFAVLSTPTAASAATTVGYQDVSYVGGPSAPSSDKPESKLWINDGIWWGDIFDTVSKTWKIFRLDPQTQTWSNTGTTLDPRAKSLADVLWDGTHLYVASHVVTISTNESPKASVANQPARLFRYSYNSATKTYSQDAGFPVNINNNSSESLVIDKASNGAIWATWTQVESDGAGGFTNAVYYNATVGSDSTWGTPAILPFTNAHPTPDDISSVIAYKTFIAVVWSNEGDGSVDWAIHAAGAPTTTWMGGVVTQSPSIADDHLNLKSLKSDTTGHIYAVVKTSLNDVSTDKTLPQVLFLVFNPSTTTWTTTTVSTIGDCSTRPLLVLDANNVAHVYLTEPDSGCSYSGVPGSIYEKTTLLSSPSFVAGRGQVIMRDGASAQLNDATSLKQSASTESDVTAQTGLVVLASNAATKYYWHSDETLGSQAPVAHFSRTPTSGAAPLKVQFTDSSTNAPTSWSWSFGDGGTATMQNPSHVFTSAGTYTISLTAANATGRSATATSTVTVSTGAGVRYKGSTSAGNSSTNTVVLPAPSARAPGDRLLAAIATRGGPTLTPPSGWTLVRQDIKSTTVRQAIYSHVATSSEPTSYTWTLSSAQGAAGVMLDYSGVSATTPVDAQGGQVGAAASKSIVAPSVTTTTNDEVVAFYGLAASSVITPPAALTGRASAVTASGTYKVTIETAQVADTVPGPTPAYTATASVSSVGIGQLVALRAG